MPEDVFLASPRKTPAHRRSAVSLRATNLADTVGDDAAANGRFSLAHELAVAMMPEPSAGSKLLAEEFGIEFDEGAEGIDEPGPGGPQIHVQDADASAGNLSFASSEPDPQLDGSFDDGPPEPPDFGGDPTFGSPPRASKQRQSVKEQDAMEVLAQDLESTDNFLAHLRRLDVDPSPSMPPSSPSAPSSSSAPASSSSSSSGQPALERLASDVIRRINDTARDREGQVRALLEYEREFRRIAGEVGGQDVLGRLDALPDDGPADDAPAPVPPVAIPEDVPPSASPTRPGRNHLRALSQDWETDPDFDRLGDTAGEADGDGELDPAYDAPPSPTSPMIASPTPASAPAPRAAAGAGPAAQLADLRGLTSSLVASLTSVSEHAQVNGAATAEAGRKIRALRNRLGGWRAEWEGAERSRGRIARWEAGEAASGESTPAATPVRVGGGGLTKRVDGRKVVAEHLHAFELALADAAVKTKAIMVHAS
ncbi:hypothetical protein FB451DRAFT_1042159 [Mycena latifolia]|nr:hypothetical protein FB451DRAFT_1042159 [Mycena latifolia]